METITWWDAWALWFSGQEVPGETYMGPLTILTWGRIGKIVSLIGGATVILDLIGTERLRVYGRRTKQEHAERIALFGRIDWVLYWPIFAVYVISASGWSLWLYNIGPNNDPLFSALGAWEYPVRYLMTAAAFILFCSGMLKLFQAAIPIIARALDTKRPAQAVRYLAAVLTLVGFHLDLLAS